jgi:hypothetical protein
VNHSFQQALFLKEYIAFLVIKCYSEISFFGKDIFINTVLNKNKCLIFQPFPKDLQYCSQMALMNYLEMKASLQDFKHSQQLLDYLEPPEIEAIGGKNLELNHKG